MFQQNTSTVATAVHGSTVPCLILQHLFSLPTPPLHSLLIRSESQNLCHVLPRKSCSQAPKHRPRDTCAATCAWHSLSLSFSLSQRVLLRLSCSLTHSCIDVCNGLLAARADRGSQAYRHSLFHSSSSSLVCTCLLWQTQTHSQGAHGTGFANQLNPSQSAAPGKRDKKSESQAKGGRERDQCQRRT